VLDIDEQDIVVDDDDTFRLEIPGEAETPCVQSRAGKVRHQFDEGDVHQDVELVLSDAESPQNETRLLTPMEAATAQRPRRKKVKLTRHGIAIPALPSSLIKRIANQSMTRRGRQKSTVDSASLKALEQATEWFFEQVGDDLDAYSNHAGRTKRIDASDVLTLMRRQRVLKGDGKLGDFAIAHLVPEALIELDLPDTL